MLNTLGETCISENKNNIKNKNKKPLRYNESL